MSQVFYVYSLCAYQTQERESTLRTQLQEASKKLEEQNVKFNMLEDRFRLAQDSSLKHEKALAEASEKLEDTQVSSTDSLYTSA